MSQKVGWCESVERGLSRHLSIWLLARLLPSFKTLARLWPLRFLLRSKASRAPLYGVGRGRQYRILLSLSPSLFLRQLQLLQRRSLLVDIWTYSPTRILRLEPRRWSLVDNTQGPVLADVEV